MADPSPDLLRQLEALPAAELAHALAKSVDLQRHYAKLLNDHDGGQRLDFADALEWVRRLREWERAKGQIRARLVPATRYPPARDGSTLPGPGRDGHG